MAKLSNPRPNPPTQGELLIAKHLGLNLEQIAAGSLVVTVEPGRDPVVTWSGWATIPLSVLDEAVALWHD